MNHEAWEAQIEADLIAEKWPFEAQSFSPWNDLGPKYADLRARARGERTEEREDRGVIDDA